jgi:EmrB/QacA subfamily drug resistance transporter
MSIPTRTVQPPSLAPPGGGPGLPSSSPEAKFTPREMETLILTTLGTLMVAIDSTIVILALPTMARELASPLETVIWTILIYLLITAALTTQAGRFGDLFGRGLVYNAGFAVFTIGSGLSGFAPNAEFLIAARAVQAIGGAVMFANAAAIISHVFPPQRRGRAFGYTVFGWSVGAILGILLGGLITTALGWRYIFFINLPIGVFAVALGLKTLPRGDRQKVEFDIPGFLSLSAALVFLCYGAIEIASYGVTALYLAYVVVGLALIPVFGLLELRLERPMVDLRQLRNRLLGFSLVAAFLQSLGYLSVIFLLTMYLQGLRGLSPLNASLLLVPGYLVGAFMGPWMGRRVDRFGPRALATAGIGAMCVAVLLYSTLDVNSWLGWIPLISLVSGIGTGMFYPANTTAIMSQAPPSQFGAISGLRGTLSNMGTLLSFVLALTIASASVPRYVAYEVFLGTTNLTGGLGSDFLGGIHAALYGSAAVLVLAAALSWSRGRAKPSSHLLAADAMPPAEALRTSAPGVEATRVAEDPIMVKGQGPSLGK